MDQLLYNLRDFDHFGRGGYIDYPNWCVFLFEFTHTTCIHHLHWNLGIHKWRLAHSTRWHKQNAKCSKSSWKGEMMTSKNLTKLGKRHLVIGVRPIQATVSYSHSSVAWAHSFSTNRVPFAHPTLSDLVGHMEVLTSLKLNVWDPCGSKVCGPSCGGSYESNTYICVV